MLIEEIQEEVPIPKDVKVSVSDHVITVEGPRGTIQRRIKYPSVLLATKKDIIVLSVHYAKKTDKAALYTIKSHIMSMIKGVEKGFCYKLKILYSHFPLNVKVIDGKVEIDNYLGEKVPRYAKIMGDTKVMVSGNEIFVEGINKEHVGQTAGNLEKATRVTKRDPRVFQDGIYLVDRDGILLRW
ncbi:MAG: 50S ribosomal protein L6 [Candidatus Methanofastidiosia archaeon]